MSSIRDFWKITKCLICGYFLCLTGCGKANVASVNGTVKFQGKPVAAGVICFQTAGGVTTSGNLDAGEYRIRELPVGPAKITVQSLMPAPTMVRADQAATAVPRPPVPPYEPVPARYLDFEKSKLQYEVKSGANTFNIDLNP